jgi:hypothetical protein
MIIVVQVFFFLSLLSADIVTFTDGTVLNTEVFSYSSLGNITLDVGNGAIDSFSSSEILSIERPSKYRLSSNIQVDPRIYYVEGVKKLFQYVPPYYIYKGVSYNIDTEWGMNSDVGMFFSFLKQEHPDLDERTLSLISDLDKRMMQQNRSMGLAGLLVASGTVMTFLPLNLDDIEATPTYGKVIAISGFSINIIGVGLMIFNAFKHQREYPKLIAESFNEYISNKSL